MEEFHIDAELLCSLHEASDEDLWALAELHEDPANDDQIELYIYICFLIFQKSCNTRSLQQAIQRAEGWATATAASHPDHGRRHSILDTLVVWGHQLRTLDEVVEAGLDSLESEEPAASKLDFPIRLQGEAERLAENFKQTGDLECLIQAIDKIVLAITMAGVSTTAGMLSRLGIFLGMRFDQTRSTDDLKQSIKIFSKLVDVTPHDHPDYASFLNNLGLQLQYRFEHKGSIEDLNQAISILSEAVDARPHNHQDCASYMYLNNLGGALAKRSQWMGSIDDLDRAIDVTIEAVNLAPHDHLDRLPCLCTFETCLSLRFLRSGSIDDLNQAISIAHEALDAMPHGHPDRASHLNNLAAFFAMRFKHMGSIDDLNQAISLLSKAVDAVPYNHPDRANWLSNLAKDLNERSNKTGSIDDCNQAMKVISEADDITPLDDPNHTDRLITFSQSFLMQSIQTGSMDNLDRMIPMLITSWHCEMTPLSRRIEAAHVVARLLMQQRDWEQPYQLLREAISLLHTVSPRFSNRTDVQALLISSWGLASTAVSAALSAGKAPGDALRLLEHGRGVIASLLMDMRGDIIDLQRQYPDLAEKYSLLRDELDLPSHRAASLASTDKVSAWELQIKQHHEANREFREVIDTIRAQPGFSSFHQPPGVKELMGAAERGPIIILNITQFRSDAFLIQPDSIQVIELPSLKYDEIQSTVTGLLGNSDLSPLLGWLWHTVCHPCLNALGIKNAASDDNWPHIWWVPTGPLSQLPLHAAGIYKHGSKETVLDRAVSSYASSIKALLHGRKHGIQKPRQPPSEDTALMVSMQETPGLGERGRLPFAADEVHMLRDLCPQLQLAPITPSQNKEDVLKHMPKCKIFHFAGHGQSDPNDPSQSCLLLEDWETNPLTVGDIRDSRLQDDPPFLAYLSACSTGANKVERLADEGIHLINAFQLAGFRHAIGTLWEVSDKHCVDVAKILYKTLQEEGMTDLAVSRGLHRAVRALRDGNADDVLTRDAKLVRPRPASQGVTDFFWVPYVHFGV